MSILFPPATNEQQSTAWDSTKDYFKEERPLRPIRKIVVKGAVDVVFRRFNEPTLVVAGENEQVLSQVKTTFEGNKLVIEREGMQIGNIFVNGSINAQFVSMGNNSFTSRQISTGKIVIGIAMPLAPDIKIKGSGNVTLLDLNQSTLDIQIQGSGDVTASGKVEQLDVEVAGSGDVDASDLIADHANLSVAGSGDIEAFVRVGVHARVAGSGGIVVRGNPGERNHQVAGSGKIKFR